MMANCDLQSTLEDLFPSTVAVYFSNKKPPNTELMPAELSGTNRMVEHRLEEFAHGRHCARAALQLLGAAPAAIPRGKDREPLWPQGITGSITHTGSIAAAAVSHSDKFDGIGLDIETDEPLNPDLLKLICRSDENIGKDFKRAKLIFSIKESIYKCLFPELRQFIDFQEVGVRLNEKNGSFSAYSDCKAINKELISRLRGSYHSSNGLIASAAWLE